MRQFFRRPSHRRTRSIRTRILRIALVPCLTAFLAGLIFSGYLIRDGVRSIRFSEVRRDGFAATSDYVRALGVERTLTMAILGGRADLRDKLTLTRGAVDQAGVAVIRHAEQLVEYAPDMSAQLGELQQRDVLLRQMRTKLDAGRAAPLETFAFYNRMLDVVGNSSKRLATIAGSAEAGYRQIVASDLYFVLDSVVRAHAIGGYVLGKPNDKAAVATFAAQVARYHEPPTAVIVNLGVDGQTAFARLVESPDWAALLAGDDALIDGKRFDPLAWDQAANTVFEKIKDIYLAHAVHTSELTEQSGRDKLVLSVEIGAGVTLLTGLLAFLAYRSASRLIGRLTALREQTVDLAENRLPALLARAGRGERVDPEQDLPQPEAGADELGEVARAFGEAQRTALAAAITEAKTRHGVRTVFLNIAHRSQAIVHRQLEELDRIERSEDDPDLVDRLFRLDHLATRTRRNAENLIILGGEQVGRQWRHPVHLQDAVRGAVSETKDYKRVTMAHLPDLYLDGSAVADVGHLLAELVDNGTSFSPPESRVQVRGVVVGKGVAFEIEDQGLGMKPEQLDRVNRMLSQPPDFSFMALADDVRIGLFVVARLADKHGIRVSLRESIYGGVQAVVLLPGAILTQRTAAPQRLPAAPAPVPAPMLVPVPAPAAV
ncbi:sensor histidine kinase, partial [Actinocorallia lasiicapitis]